MKSRLCGLAVLAFSLALVLPGAHAQAPEGRMPTTRAPGSGPLPSAAAVSTIPAKSQPGRQPGSATCKARRVSPRLR